MKYHTGCSDRHKRPEDPFRPVQYERSLSVLQLSDNFIQTIFEQYSGKCNTQNRVLSQTVCPESVTG